MAQSRDGYIFPTLERKEILKCLSHMGITEKDLMKPSKEIIWPLYEHLVQDLVGIPRNELHQPVLGALDSLKYPEMHEDAIGTLASVRAITQLMKAAGVDDFALKDIFRPEPKRTIHNLSALINFALFRQERQIQDTEVDLAEEKIQQLNERSLQLTHAIAQKEAERRAEEPQVQNLSKEVIELEQKIYSLNKHKEVLQSHNRGIKDELHNLTEKIVSEKARVAEMTQEGSQLRTQIVQSPEKLQKMLEDKRLAVQNAEADVETARVSAVKWKNKLESYRKAKKKVQKCVNKMDALDKQTVLQKEMVKDLKEMKMKHKENEDRLSSINAQLEQLKAEGEHYTNLKEKLDVSFESKCREADKEIEEFKMQTAPLTDTYDTLEEQIAEKQEEVERLQKGLDEARIRKEAGLKALHDEVELIQNEILRHNESLLPEFYGHM